MVDCSHANSSKQHEKQLDVARDLPARLLVARTACSA